MNWCCWVSAFCQKDYWTLALSLKMRSSAIQSIGCSINEHEFEMSGRPVNPIDNNQTVW